MNLAIGGSEDPLMSLVRMKDAREEPPSVHMTGLFMLSVARLVAYSAFRHSRAYTSVRSVTPRAL